MSLCTLIKRGFSSVQGLELQPLSHGREMCHSNYSTIRTFLSCFNSLSMNRKTFPQVKGLLLTGYMCRRCFLLLFLICLQVGFFLNNILQQAKMVVAVNVLVFVFDLGV